MKNPSTSKERPCGSNVNIHESLRKSLFKVQYTQNHTGIKIIKLRNRKKELIWITGAGIKDDKTGRTKNRTNLLAGAGFGHPICVPLGFWVIWLASTYIVCLYSIPGLNPKGHPPTPIQLLTVYLILGSLFLPFPLILPQTGVAMGMGSQ